MAWMELGLAYVGSMILSARNSSLFSVVELFRFNCESTEGLFWV